jgi:hypothetical protein
MGKNICFLLAAASRATINVRFARRNNIGDIAGKAVSQFTASTLFGVGGGIVLSKIIDISMFWHLVPTFAILTAMTTYTSYIAAKVIDEHNFNNQRAYLFFNEYIKNG